MSNGKYKSVLHRAVVNDKATRISIALSNGSSPDTVITPVEQLVDGKNNRAVHIGMKYKDVLELQERSVLNGKSGLDGVYAQPELSELQQSSVHYGKSGLVGSFEQPELSELQQRSVLYGKSSLDGVFTQPELSELQQSSELCGKSSLDGVHAQLELSELQQSSELYGKSSLDGVHVQLELSELQQNSELYGKSSLDGVHAQLELSELQQNSELYGKSGLDGVLVQPELSELQQNSILYGKSGLDGVQEPYSTAVFKLVLSVMYLLDRINGMSGNDSPLAAKDSLPASSADSMASTQLCLLCLAALARAAPGRAILILPSRSGSCSEGTGWQPGLLHRDTWTSLSIPNFTWTIRGNSRAILNGSAHWLAAPTEDVPYDSIMAFGMEEESFGEVIELPQLENLSQFSLNLRGKAALPMPRGSLALIAFGILLPMVDEKLVCCDEEDMQISEVGIQGGGPESSSDVIDWEEEILFSGTKRIAVHR
ncbi:hypothetical protein NL676_038969 [Syzygium grande]|nr:hypothetical protein NL676_038969 [Syzygium grande]